MKSLNKIQLFFIIYGVFLTFVPYVNEGITHLKAVIFSLIVALVATLASFVSTKAKKRS